MWAMFVLAGVIAVSPADAAPSAAPTGAPIGAPVAGAARDARTPPPSVSVQGEDGTYRVAATFSVAPPAAVAMDVLTDYEGIPRFMTNVRTSRVIERRDRRTVVEQEAIARVMMFSRRISLVLEIDEGPGTALTFRDRSGRCFSRYEGSWTVAEADGRVTVTYTLTATPTFDVPGFLLKRLLKRDALDMIEHLQDEIAARAN